MDLRVTDAVGQFTGAVLLEGGDLVLTSTEDDSLAQDLAIWIGQNRGENPWDSEDGIPWLDLVDVDDAIVRQWVFERLTRHRAVTIVNEVTVTSDRGARTRSITWRVNESIEGAV